LTQPTDISIRDTDFFNNTFIDTSNGYGTYDFSLKPRNPTNCRVFNNIYYRSGKYMVGYFSGQANAFAQWASMDYNCLADVGTLFSGDSDNTTTWQQWQQDYGQDVNSIRVDPQFVDAPNNNYRLQVGSPCRNAGKDLLGLWGNPGQPVAMGAYVTGDEVIGVRT
jgi:hypothetical protein